MRAKNLTRGNLMRWDESPDRDPRRVCFTCRSFDRDEAVCHNKMKRCSVDDLPCSGRFTATTGNLPCKGLNLAKCDCRKIFYYKVMRCELHDFHPNFDLFMKSEHVTESLAEIQQKINDLKMDLSCLQDIKDIKQTYGMFLIEKPDINDEPAKEIDLDIHMNKEPFRIHLDNIDTRFTKVFKNTVRIRGFEDSTNQVDACNPIHYSIYAHDAQPSNVSVEFVRTKVTATFYQNGCEFDVAANQMVELLQDNAKILKTFDIAKQYETAMHFIENNFLPILSRTLFRYPTIRYPCALKFSNLANFECRFQMYYDHDHSEKSLCGEITLIMVDDTPFMTFSMGLLGSGEYHMIHDKFQEKITSSNFKLQMEKFQTFEDE